MPRRRQARAMLICIVRWGMWVPASRDEGNTRASRPLTPRAARWSASRRAVAASRCTVRTPAVVFGVPTVSVLPDPVTALVTVMLLPLRSRSLTRSSRSSPLRIPVVHSSSTRTRM